MIVVGAILAGGAASRMGGAPKGLLAFDGVRAIDRVAGALRALPVERILVSTNAPAAASWLEGAELVPDVVPGSGPLGALVSVLAASRGTTVVVAWDMPWVTTAVLRPLLAAAAGHDAAMYRREGRHEPLCAVYQPSAVTVLSAAFEAGERGVRRALRGLRVAEVPANARTADALASINTPDDARRAAPAFPSIPVIANDA